MHTYRRTNTYRPFTINEDQEMWFAEISYYRDKITPGDIDHHECVEVRAETEILLNHRVKIIVDALNKG